MKISRAGDKLHVKTPCSGEFLTPWQAINQGRMLARKGKELQDLLDSDPTHVIGGEQLPLIDNEENANG